MRKRGGRGTGVTFKLPFSSYQGGRPDVNVVLTAPVRACFLRSWEALLEVGDAWGETAPIKTKIHKSENTPSAFAPSLEKLVRNEVVRVTLIASAKQQ